MIEKRSQKAPFLLFFHRNSAKVMLKALATLCIVLTFGFFDNPRIMLSSVDWLTPLIVASLLMEMPRSSQSVRIRFL